MCQIFYTSFIRLTTGIIIELIWTYIMLLTFQPTLGNGCCLNWWVFPAVSQGGWRWGNYRESYDRLLGSGQEVRPERTLRDPQSEERQFDRSQRWVFFIWEFHLEFPDWDLNCLSFFLQRKLRGFVQHSSTTSSSWTDAAEGFCPATLKLSLDNVSIMQ